MGIVWAASLLGVLALGAGIAAALAWRECRRLRDRQRAREAEMRALRADVVALCAASAGVGERMGRLEQQLRRLLERQDRLELRDPGSRPYAQAIRLVQNGAQVDELMSTCALTRGEAELVVMLHGMELAAQPQRQAGPR